ncbi:MAG TPA: hypothetical protein VFF11_13055, partial [Candidatus Binatia bacterium]|nr:hypothetical protein [Candidatus Binatia bacterium]
MSLWFCLVWCAATRAETMTMTDGASFSGDIVKFDDNGLLLRMGDSYTNLMWGRFSQESLKQLASSNPKIAQLVDVFIVPDQSQRPARAKIKINPVTRLDHPANPSLFGGLFKSGLGLFILFALYVANLYAAYEVAIIRARPAAQVMGLSAVLPLAGPIIFLWMPMKQEAPPQEELEPLAPAPVAEGGEAAAVPEVQVVDAAWKQEEKKPEPQVYARGKFTFNKRFIETKFAGYIGSHKGDAAKFNMEVKTPKGQFA